MHGNTGCWVGIDVAKSKLDVALLDERGELKSHVFDNNAKGQVTATRRVARIATSSA